MEFDGKCRCDTGEQVSIRKEVTVAAVVLLAVVAVGMFFLEYRFRSSRVKDLTEAPEAVRSVEEPVIIAVQKAAVVEEGVIEPVPIEPEPVWQARTIAEVDGQSESGVEERMAAEPVFEDPKDKAMRARVALTMIGYDPAADVVYIQLINDPSVSSNDRHNLIEDLNEDGFPDPDNPTLDDLPMIQYRIDFIDDQSPYAMDQTNADAFAEARKDLVNMVNRLTQ